jgi:hypothetical protein
MDNNEPFHLKKFNSKVRAMNQARSSMLTLTAAEAQSLQAEIYDLLATIASLSKVKQDSSVISVNMDGGGFK